MADDSSKEIVLVGWESRRGGNWEVSSGPWLNTRMPLSVESTYKKSLTDDKRGSRDIFRTTQQATDVRLADLFIRQRQECITQKQIFVTFKCELEYNQMWLTSYPASQPINSLFITFPPSITHFPTFFMATYCDSIAGIVKVRHICQALVHLGGIGEKHPARLGVSEVGAEERPVDERT